MNFKDTLQKKHNLFIKLLLLQAGLFLVFSSFHIHKDDPKKVKIIVIDPGHGGKDPGCNGVSHKEKDVSLAVALKLGKLIEENLKDVKVIFTRKTDVFVDLEDRAKIANDNNADLFISIHCNAAGKPVMVKDKKTGKMRPKTFKNSRGKMIVVETANPVPFGSETYVMGLKNEEGKMKVAQRENSAMLLEDNYESKYKGFDPNSEESYIIMSNYTSSYVIQSAGLAMKIQEEYFTKAGRVDKGVHRQSIWVLWRTSMPSVLTEIGYLTNPEEEKFLGSTKGQDYMASCLFRAFRKYKDEQEGTKKTYDDDLEKQKPLENENYKIENDSDKKDQPVVLDKPDEKKDVEIKKDNFKNKEEEIDNAKKYSEYKKLADSEFKNKNYKQAKEYYQKAQFLIKVEDDYLKHQLAQIDDLLKKEEETKNHISENERKYKQYIALADLNYKNKKYEEALVLYEKANDLYIKNEVYAAERIKDIKQEFKANDDKVAKDKAAAEEKIRLAQLKAKQDSIDKALAKANPPKSGIEFKVQFASTDKEVDAKTKFPNVSDVWFYKMGAVYKYTSGSFRSFEEAGKHQAKLRELGYKDCFVAAFKNGVRMDIAEAKKAVQ